MDDIKKFEPFFSNWYLDSLIGEGNYDKVYLIHRSEYGREVQGVMKVVSIPMNPHNITAALSEGMTEDQLSAHYKSLVDRIVADSSVLAEAGIADHIAPYEECTIIKHEDGIGWDLLLRMDYLTPVSSYFSENRPTQTQVVTLGMEICSALEHCHAHNIIHKNIKPENIFVGRNGNYMLGDFGVASNLEELGISAGASSAYSYCSPELYSNKEASTASDIYSLGMVMYKLLNNGRSPFISATQKSVSFMQSHTAFTRRMDGEPLPKPNDADDELSEIILRACAFDPRDRFVSAAHFREALESVLYSGIRKQKNNIANMPVEATVAQETDASEFFRNRAAAQIESDDESEPFIPDETVGASPKSSKVPGIIAICVAAVVFLGIGAYLLFSSGIIGAKEQVLEDANFKYLAKSGEAVITEYKGAGSEIIIPDKIGEYNVTGIGKDVFANLGISNVTFSQNIRSIGVGAFSNCDYISSFILPQGLTEIGQGAFSGCDSLVSIAIPAGVAHISDWAFSYCDHLQNVGFEPGLVSIGQAAFYSCGEITNITLPASVTDIGEACFAQCGNLTTVSLSVNTESIADYAFQGCASLENIYIPATATSIGANSFVGCDKVNIYSPANSYAANYALLHGYTYTQCE